MTNSYWTRSPPTKQVSSSRWKLCHYHFLLHSPWNAMGSQRLYHNPPTREQRCIHHKSNARLRLLDNPRTSSANLKFCVVAHYYYKRSKIIRPTFNTTGLLSDRNRQEFQTISDLGCKNWNHRIIHSHSRRQVEPIQEDDLGCCEIGARHREEDWFDEDDLIVQINTWWKGWVNQLWMKRGKHW